MATGSSCADVEHLGGREVACEQCGSPPYEVPNTGVEKARVAAREVNGTIVVPSFEPDDTARTGTISA